MLSNKFLSLNLVVLAVFIVDKTDSIDTPTLEVVPLPDGKQNTLIYYKSTQQDSFKPWVDKIEKFLEPYKVPGSRVFNLTKCSYDYPARNGLDCDFDAANVLSSQCSSENSFNYHKSSPCVFLKLSNVPDWIPAYYNNSNKLPSEMPTYLKEYILYITHHHQDTLNQIWISCEGKTPTDVEAIGPITYYPGRGFPGYYFPYKNSPSYFSPLVAINFERPALNVTLNIVCKAWAENIVHNINNGIGSVQFQLLIE